MTAVFDTIKGKRTTRRSFLKYGATAAVAGVVGASFPYFQGWKGGIVGDNETSSLVTSNSTSVTSNVGKPSIVFAHGLFADGSCFSKVIPTLQADGYEVMSTQNSLDTLQGDVDAVTRVFDQVSSPIVLVGHSYGGTVITAAGTDPRVAGLVYIAALAPDETETSQSLQAKFPETALLSHIQVTDGRIWMLPAGTQYFAGDLSEQEQQLIWATQGAPAVDLFTNKVDGTAWRSKPSWYIVATNDQTVQPDLERFCAQRMGATTYEVASSHVPMLSNPSFVINVILAAANSVQQLP